MKAWKCNDCNTLNESGRCEGCGQIPGVVMEGIGYQMKDPTKQYSPFMGLLILVVTVVGMIAAISSLFLIFGD
mgnify:CR=1 FL=1